MRKNIINEAIEILGISEGDVIKIPYENGEDFYKYENGKFTYLNNEEKFNLSDDEIYELLTGREFEIVAYGNKKADFKESELTYISNQLDRLLKYENERIKQEEEKKKISKWIDIAVFASWGLVLLICLISKIF